MADPIVTSIVEKMYGDPKPTELDELRGKVARIEGFADMLEESGNVFFAELLRTLLED